MPSMFRDLKLTLFLIALITLAVVHFCALSFALYYKIPWFDSVMHLWGGVLIGLGAQTQLFLRIARIYPKTHLENVLLVLCIGGAWEIFEWHAGISVIVEHYQAIFDNYRAIFMFDTIKDLILDMLGGALGFWLAAHIVIDEDIT